MAVSAEAVAEGKFFKTPKNRIRAVLEVANGRVKFTDGGTDFRNRQWDHWQWQKLGAFIAEVDAEVEETWDPNYKHREISADDTPDDSES
jgi:hypothetical protein